MKVSKKMELVLGAGGVKGYLHIGLLKAAAELGITFTKVTGVSVGAIIAALLTNGKSWKEILQIFLDAHEKSGNPLLLASAIVLPTDWRKFLISPTFLSLEKPWEKACEELGLVPNDLLRIVGADAKTHEAVEFNGLDYPMYKALSASGALPGVFQSVSYNGKDIIDGAAYHRNPDTFCVEPAIISQLGFAKTLPREILDPLSMYFHLRELYLPIVQQETKVDTSKHLLIEHAADDVCGLSFALSEARCLKMVDQGYDNMMRAWDEAQKEDR
jgi:Predicted esterase of the alpha-beta hydrolase superfamily